MKTFLIALLCYTATISTALADEWTGPDKLLHAQAGALVGVISTIAIRDIKTACALATAAGAAKEIWDLDRRHKNTASFKDFAVTAISGCLTSKITGLVITPNQIVYVWRF